MPRRLAAARATPRLLVENRVSFAGPQSELSIYDTFLPAADVQLSADQLLFCGMTSGKKVLRNNNGFEVDFLPNECFVMSPGSRISIDFPEATTDTPTTCLTIEITRERLQQVCDHLNHKAPLQKDYGDWQYRAEQMLHTPHNPATQALLSRLIETFSEDPIDRDILIDYGISELLVRMLRQQTRDFLLQTNLTLADSNGIANCLQDIQKTLDKPLDIDRLSRIACMSRSRFFTEFKKHLGCSPAEFQHQLRLDTACVQLRRGQSVTSTAYAVGYQNPSHFSRRFQQRFGESPRAFQEREAGKTPPPA